MVQPRDGWTSTLRLGIFSDRLCRETLKNSMARLKRKSSVPLSASHPHLLAEWDFTVNSSKSPDEVSLGTHEKVGWKCSVGHQYQMRVYSKASGRGCPICSGKQVLSGHNDLASQNPTLAAEWDFDENGELGPDSVTTGSNKKVAWRCQRGHQFWQIVAARTAGADCPYCSGKKVLVGFNDLGTMNPSLASEWDGAANSGLSPEQVTVSSNKKVAWVCTLGHRWHAGIASRTAGNGCPYCAGKRPVKGENDLGTRRPDIAEEWDHRANSPLKPQDVTWSSGKKVAWRCPQNHPYTATVSSRTSAGTGCPVCRGLKIIAAINDFPTRFPELMAEWDDSKNSRQFSVGLSPASTKKVHWICPYGHSYCKTVKARASGVGCPYCAGKEILPGFNDLASRFPALAEQWDLKKNGDLLPSAVTAFSHRRVFWKCREGHSFQNSISTRAQGIGCPECAEYGFKPGQMAVLYLLYHPELRARKIGIAGASKKNDRIAAMQKRGWQVLRQWRLFGALAREAETAGLRWIREELGLPQFLRREDMGRRGGETETFSAEAITDEEVINKLESIIRESSVNN